MLTQMKVELRYTDKQLGTLRDSHKAFGTVRTSNVSIQALSCFIRSTVSLILAIRQSPSCYGADLGLPRYRDKNDLFIGSMAL